MNKRNTVIASMVLVVLVVLLLGKSVIRHHHRSPFMKVNFIDQLDMVRDMKILKGFDSATIEACDLPIVFHYSTPVNIDGSYSMNHIVGLTYKSLADMKNAPTFFEAIGDDSANAIHVYPKTLRNKTTKILLGVYNKIAMSQVVEYTYTYPKKDSLGMHIASDSGVFSSEMKWSFYGTTDLKDIRKNSDEKMRKQVENSLIKEIAKKMKQ